MRYILTWYVSSNTWALRWFASTERLHFIQSHIYQREEPLRTLTFWLSGSCWKDFKCLQLSYFPFSSSSVDFSPLLYSNFFFIIFLLSFSCLFTSEAICRLRSAYLLPWDRMLKEGFRNSFLSQLKFTHAHFDLRWSFGLSLELVFSHLIDIYMPGV